jgi:sodium/hydrogen exchanger-like protein 6/7/sodium/hydrogen exchanger 8
MFQILSICSLLCSSDVIAAISMISYNDQPKLFSIVYGEGVFNDIVSIILFNTVESFKTDFNFTAQTPFKIMGQFFLLAVYSIGIGIIFAVFSSLLFKWFRFLCHSSVTETLVIFLIALMTYYTSEAMELSGMISLLTGGIAMAHYTWYNLSPQGKTISSVAVSIFGSAAEAMVFAYMGLCICTYATDATTEDKTPNCWSLSFIFWMTFIVIFGRIIGVWFTHYLLLPCMKKPDVTLRELCFITYGGMIRGAIAFGLVLKIPDEPETFRERSAIITTTLALVIFTTVGFGTFMKFSQVVFLPEEANNQSEGHNIN